MSWCCCQEGGGDGVSLTPAEICAAINGSCSATVVTNADGSVTVTGTDGSTATVPAHSASEADLSNGVRAGVSGDANAANGSILTLAESWNEDPSWWSVAGNELVYSGPPARVEIEGSIAYTSTGARVSPITVLEINGTGVAEGRQGYIRQLNNDSEASNTVTWTGPINPGDTIRLTTQRDGTTQVAPIDLAHLSAVATTKIGVLVL